MSTQTELEQKHQQWKIKLQLASKGSFQAIQELKEHLFASVPETHTIHKQSFYDILSQGYELYAVKKLDSMNKKNYDMFIDLPLVFLLEGQAEIRCINLEGDFDVVDVFQGKGIVEIDRHRLIEKFGVDDLNMLTCFEIVAMKDSVMVEISGKNKVNDSTQQKIEKSEQQLMQEKRIAGIMNEYTIIPTKESVKVKVNKNNLGNIKDKLYLISGRACFYLDDEKQVGQRIILACYTQGYINPRQYPLANLQKQVANKVDKKKPASSIRKNSTGLRIQNSFSAISRGLKTPNQSIREMKKTQQEEQEEQSKIKFIIFEDSQIVYFQEEFIREELIKSIQNKRNQHFLNIINKYKKLSKQKIQEAQERIIARHKLNRKIVDAQIYKIADKGQLKEMGRMSSSKRIILQRLSSTDKKLNSKTELRSTASSVKGNIRIRKSRKAVQL